MRTKEWAEYLVVTPRSAEAREALRELGPDICRMTQTEGIIYCDIIPWPTKFIPDGFGSEVGIVRLRRGGA